MTSLFTKKATEIVLSGLLQDPLGGQTKLEFTDTTSGIHVSLTRIIPNGYGGQASISLDMQLPTGEEAFIGYFHLLNLSLGSLMDSLSTSLNMCQRAIQGGGTASSSTPVPEQETGSLCSASETTVRLRKKQEDLLGDL